MTWIAKKESEIKPEMNEEQIKAFQNQYPVMFNQLFEEI